MANATAISKVSFKTDSYMQITVELSFIEAKHNKSGTIVKFGHATIVSDKKINNSNESNGQGFIGKRLLLHINTCVYIVCSWAFQSNYLHFKKSPERLVSLKKSYLELGLYLDLCHFLCLYPCLLKVRHYYLDREICTLHIHHSVEHVGKLD